MKLVDCHVIPIYDVPFIFVVGEQNLKKILPRVKTFSKKINRGFIHTIVSNIDPEEYASCYGSAWSLNSDSGARGILLQISPDAVKDKNLHEVLGHEISHVIDRICEHCSIPMTLETTEPRAFLTGYLHDYCYKAMKR